MKISKNIFICALLVLMLLVCVNAVSAEESLNETLGADTVDDVVVADAPVDELSASGDTYVVDANGGGDYTSISAAVSAASGGETIFIKNGEYTETSKIDIGTKQLTFTGESQDGVIIKSGDNDLFYTTGSDGASLVISGLTFKDISMTGARTPIFIGGNDNVEITDCTFDNCASRYGALRIFTSGTVTVDNCKFLGTKSSTGSYSSAIDFGGSGTADYTLKNSIIDGSEISSASTASYIFGAIYNEKSTGTVILDNVVIRNCNLTSASGLIATKGNMNIKNSRIVNNYVYRDLAIAGLFFVNGAKTFTIETSVIVNNSQPNQILSANSASATYNLNYNNIQNNSFNNAFTYTDGTYTLDCNYWGSNDAPAGVTVNDYAIYENGEFKLNSGNPMEKEIPELGDETGPEPASYDVYVSPDGTGDGSSYETPMSDLMQAFENVPAGGSIFFCNGLYNLWPMALYKNVALVGESRDGVILKTDGQGPAFTVYDVFAEEPMTSDADLDFISISDMTFSEESIDAFLMVCSSVKEVNVTNCVLNAGIGQTLVVVGCNLLYEPFTEYAGTLNFKNNVLIDDAVTPAISIAGLYDANINNNLFLDAYSGENLISAEGTINVDYNYWGSNSPATTLEYHEPILVMASSNATEIYNDESAKITVAVTLADGTTSAKGYIPEYPIEATLTAAGDLSANAVTLQNCVGQVTYTSDVARSDNIRINVLGQTLTVPITVKERYLGPIYVATTGSDDNDGSENAPVATVAKAVELALVNGGSGEVIINEGTYTGNGYHVTGDLKVTGNGKVTLDANNEGRLFYMSYGDAADKIELSNLILTNSKGYGAAVYSFANELILDNVTIVDTQADGYLISSKGKLTIKDSEISNSMSGDVIQQTGNGDILINNTVFKDNSIVDSTSVMAVINLNSNSGNLVIENSKFINNTARQGVIKGNYNYNIDVKGTEFIDNTNTVSYGGAIYTTGGTLKVTDSVFVNNKAARSGGAIYVGYRATATIDKSIFVNNVANIMNDDDYHGDAIYDGNKLTVNNSVLLTNSNNGLIYSDGEDNVPYAQNCWWGTNDDPSSLNGIGYYEDDDWEEYDCPAVDVSNWATMDASFTPADAQAGEEVTVTAVFSNANLPDGINVTFTSTSGNLNTVVSTVDAQASTTYTIDANDEAIVATSTNAVVEMPIAKELTNIVTNDTFYNYFDENGMLLDTIEFDELIFQGEFSDLVDTIIIADEITLTSDNAVLNNIALSIIGDDVTVNGFTLNENNANFTNNGGAAIYVSGSDVTLNNVSVTYVAPSETEAIAVFANGADNFALINSEIIYTSTNPGDKHNYGLKVKNSDEAIIDNNTISAVLPAVPVSWGGEGIDQDLVLAVGIQGGDDVEFTNNVVTVNTNGAIGSYPTVDAVMIHSANDILVKGNNITHVDTTSEDGARYYYSLDIYSTTGTVEGNNIIVNTTAGVDRAGTAYPIQLTGPATVTIKGNNLTAVSKGPTNAIYASNWAGVVDLTVENNNIDVTGYATTGNYALVSGIEAEIDVLKAYNNTIVVKNGADYDDANQVYGISMASSWFSGDAAADIKDNNITVDGKYAVYYAKAVNTNVTGNTLYGHELEGDDAAAIDAGTNNVIKDNLPIKPYDGIIYVDLAGSDDNNGAIDAPVATIAKAVELALAGSGQIIVNEGTYDVPQVSVAGDLNITSNGTVVFKAQDATKKAFWITSGDVSITGVTFTNFNATYSGSVIRLDAGSLAIDDCNFIKNGGEHRQALIQVKGSDLTLTNTVFEDNTASKTGTSYGNVYLTNNGNIVSTLYANNVTFKNNHNKYGAFYLGSTIAAIYNSTFIGNNATSSSGGNGAAIYASGTATYVSSYSGNLMNGSASYVLVDGCDFINNTAFGGTYYAGQGGAIYVNNNVTMFINDCLFENNKVMNTTGNDKPGQGGAIYASAGKVIVTKSIFKDNEAAEGPEIYMRYYNSHLHPEEVNTLNISNSIILNDGVAIVADSTNGTYVANDNWWGTNDEPADKVSNVVVDSWAKMDASFTPEGAYKGEVNVTATFDVELPDGINVTFTSTSGALDTTVATVDGKATTTYTIDAADTAIIATSTDAVVEMPIVKPLANITVADAGAWIGTDGTVTVTVPNATGTVTIEVNGKSYDVELVDGVATKDIPAEDLVAGENIVTATYNGPDFSTNNATGVLFVIDGVVTQDTYLFYFNQADNGRLFDYIPDGATLDFQGSIINPDQSITVQMNVNKPVNIVSTTNDAYVDLNTTAGSLLGESPGNSFAITNGGSGSNVTGINFHNTQLWFSNTHDVVLDNISNVVEDQRVGSGVGATSIRDNSTNVLLKNSYFYTRNNGGSTTFTFSWANNCTIDNCTVKAEGNVGNLIYLNIFNVANAPSGVPLNNYNTVSNNKIYGKEGSAISVGLMVEGSHNLIVNNTLYKSSISTAFGGSNPNNNTYVGNVLTDGGSLTAQAYSIVYGNNVTGALSTGKGSVAYDNVVGGKLTVGQDAIAYDNTVGNGLATGGTNAVIENNTITGAVTINKVGTTFVGNDVNGTVTVSANDNIIKGNNITTTGAYAVDLGSKTGNNVTDNYLIASELTGDAAVRYTNENNIVENNYPYDLNITFTEDFVMAYNDGSAWNITLLDASGNPIAGTTVKVGIAGHVYNRVTDVDGVAKLPIKLGPGVYDINATIESNGYYYDAFVNGTVTVNKGVAVLSTNDLVMDYKDGSAWIVGLTDANGDAIKGVYIDANLSGKVYRIKTNDSGMAKITINLAPGTYDISASLNNTKFEAEAVSATITVNKVTPVLTGDDLVVEYGSGSDYAVTLTDADGNPIANSVVKITIGDKTYNRKTDANGVASLPINLAIGNYTVTAKFEGNSKYGEVEINNTIVVTKPDLSIVASDINMTYKDGTSYAVQLTDGDGNPVALAGEIIKVTIKGKTYNRKTNADGIATLPINLGAGTWTVTAEYDGKEITNTIVVNKAEN